MSAFLNAQSLECGCPFNKFCVEASGMIGNFDGNVYSLIQKKLEASDCPEDFKDLFNTLDKVHAYYHSVKQQNVREGWGRIGVALMAEISLYLKTEQKPEPGSSKEIIQEAQRQIKSLLNESKKTLEN